jgi:hypothetical protein
VFAAHLTVSEGSPQARVSGVSRTSLCRPPRSITCTYGMPSHRTSQWPVGNLGRAGESEDPIKPRPFRSVSRFFLGNRMSVRPL